jgi:hypothetical protein
LATGQPRAGLSAAANILPQVHLFYVNSS